MRTTLAAALAALALAGCEAGTSHGFAVERPAGWKDATDAAEVKTGGEFEVVYEGPRDDEVTSTITIARGEVPEEVGLASAVERARRFVRGGFPDSKPTPSVEAELGGEPALRFDYRAGPKRARQISALRGGELYVVTMESSQRRFTDDVRVLEALRASWRWE